MSTEYDSFLKAFVESFSGKTPIICDVLANIFSMRIIGNKTHGDIAEIALTEYINQYVKGYSAKHVGKERFRAKTQEEDISVTDKKTNKTILISIKTYGKGPLQLSTNKKGTMFALLTKEVGRRRITALRKIRRILGDPIFGGFNKMNVIPLIYNEKEKKFKIIIFDVEKAYSSVKQMRFIPPRKLGKKKTFPIYKFYGDDDQYIFEVRYGAAGANALQRGMWTHTENAAPFFREVLKGEYEYNLTLIELISKIMVSREQEHKKILDAFFAK